MAAAKIRCHECGEEIGGDGLVWHQPGCSLEDDRTTRARLGTPSAVERIRLLGAQPTAPKPPRCCPDCAAPLGRGRFHADACPSARPKRRARRAAILAADRFAVKDFTTRAIAADPPSAA